MAELRNVGHSDEVTKALREMEAAFLALNVALHREQKVGAGASLALAVFMRETHPECVHGAIDMWNQWRHRG